MPFDPNKFINAGQFGDYSSYSGMGGDQQMKSVRQVLAEAAGVPAAGGVTPDQVSAPVAPPQSFGEMATQQFNQAIAPIQKKATNISNAFDQASQGNGVAAVNAYRGFSPTQPTTQPNTQPYSQPTSNLINQHYGVEE
jgi:hypothetical protein